MRQALADLVTKLDAVHADKRYESVWTVSQLHIGPYTGPTYAAELEAAREALAASPPPGAITAAKREAVEAFREMAIKAASAWRDPSAVRLAAGEMTAQEMRTAQAVAGGIERAIRSIPNPYDEA